MFREQYNKLNNQVSPSEELLQDTIRKAEKIENKSQSSIFSFRKPAVAFLAVCLCLSLGMPTLAATVEPIYNFMYLVSPTIAQLFMPVHKSDEDNGVKMEVISAYIHDNVAEIYIAMQDLTGNRIDGTTDLFDSYSINRPFDSSAHCKRVGYDESTGTVTFLITIEEWGNKEIAGDKITFTVKEFLSHKKTYEDVEIPVFFSAVGAAKETHKPSHIRGGSGPDFKQLFDRENAVALVPSAPISGFPVEGIDLTGMGYIDGKLHIQTAVTNNLENDNHGFFYLEDKDGNRIDYSYSFSFVNQDERVGQIDYSDYVFDVPQSEISSYTLYGFFVTSGMITKGNWKVTFPLES